jgi:hypothetical protein
MVYTVALTINHDCTTVLRQNVKEDIMLKKNLFTQPDHRIFGAMCFAACLWVFASCSKSTADGAPREAKTELTIAITKDINGLDAQNPGNTLTQAILYNFFEPILMRSANDEIIP